MSVINFEQSSWFIPLCLLISAGLTYLLYSKSNPWGKTINGVLTGLRFVLITILTLLLLNPLLKQFIQQIEKPLIVIAMDDSESMMINLDSIEGQGLLNRVTELQESLRSKNYDVEFQTLSGSTSAIENVKFRGKTSNIKAWIDDLQSEKEGVNLTRMYLISDGIYNQGVSPAYFPYSFAVNTLGVGDTLQKADVVLKNVLFNKIAYQGNRFPVLVDIVNYGFQGERSEVQVWSGSQLVDSKTIKFEKYQQLQSVQLEVNAVNQGYQRLRIVVRPMSNEEMVVNNQKNIYVDVVDGKQKILLIAPSPHPDIKALSAVIKNNENYELNIFIPGVTDYKQEKYDLVIAHESYDRWNRCKKYIEVLKEEGVPIFHIVGKVSQLTRFSEEEQHIDIVQQRNQRDNVYGALNQGFRKFTIADVTNKNLASFPPLSVPYADYSLSPHADVLLYQRIGSVTTDKPLLFVVEENDQKSGYFLADDFWKWRMQEFAIHENAETFDEILMKVIQYLSTKVDKRKFRFSTIDDEYFTNEVIQFQAELYSEIYERVYDQEIKVKISNESGFSEEASYIPTSSFSRMEFSGLDEGTYRYEAETSLNNEKEIVKGVFVVKELQLEQLDHVAKFDMLRQLSDNSGGRFYSFPNDTVQLFEEIQNMDDKNIIHTAEENLPLIHLKWILLLIFLLVSTEWLCRKYYGGY